MHMDQLYADKPFVLAKTTPCEDDCYEEFRIETNDAAYDYFQGVVSCGLVGLVSGICGGPIAALAFGGVCFFDVVLTYCQATRRASRDRMRTLKAC